MARFIENKKKDETQELQCLLEIKRGKGLENLRGWYFPVNILYKKHRNQTWTYFI
jgi:hypothetical protein